MTRDQDRWDNDEARYKSERDERPPTANHSAAKVANLARELAAIMETYPRLNPRDQAKLIHAANLIASNLVDAWHEFLRGKPTE